MVLSATAGVTYVLTASEYLPQYSVLETQIGSAILVSMLLTAAIGALFVRFRKR